MSYYLAVLKKYAVFSGRANRAEFWWFALGNFIVFVVLSIVQSVVFGSNSELFMDMGILPMLYWLAVVVPSFAVTVRRLHDTDRSGWWLLIGLVPFVGGIVLLVFYLLGGTPGANRYGLSPAGRPEGMVK
ncbi:MAG: DUF805 domain-containing protein [bacterium]